MCDCPLQLNTDRLWQCPDCNWIYKPRRPTFLCRKPPRRNCPAKRTPEQIAEQEKQQARAKWLAEHGAGGHLHRIIKTVTGEGITSSCGCKNRIAEMDRNGPQWCRDNIETIIDWMLEEVERRLKATQDDGKAPPWRLRLGGMELPGRRYAVRRMILVAVRRAEQDGAKVKK